MLLADGVEGAGALLIQERKCVEVSRHDGWVLARQLPILFYDLTDARVQIHVFRDELLLFAFLFQNGPKLVPDLLRLLHSLLLWRVYSTVCDALDFFHRPEMVRVLNEGQELRAVTRLGLDAFAGLYRHCSFLSNNYK